MKLELFDTDDIKTEGAWTLSETFYFRNMLQVSSDGLVTKLQSMLNIAIFDPW